MNNGAAHRNYLSILFDTSVAFVPFVPFVPFVVVDRHVF
jgi:hypothetical protein